MSSARSKKRETGANRFLPAVLAALGALGAGCARRPPPPPAPLSTAEAAGAADRLAAAAAGVHRYQAVFGVRGTSTRGRFSGRLLVVLEQIAEDDAAGSRRRLRLEAYGPVGGPRWILVAQSGERVRVVSPVERAWAEGDALAPFAAELLGIPLGMDDFAAVAVGTGVPIPEGPVRPDPAGTALVVPGGARIWLRRGDGGGLRVVRARAETHEIRYPGDDPPGPGSVPRRIEVTAGEIVARLAVEELQVNAALHPDSFALRIPSGYRRLTAAGLAAAVPSFRR